jgi:PII-like signaling protein
MNGYQLAFYTTLGRRMQGKPIKDWLIGLARQLGIPGATVFAGIEGYGHDRRFHSAHFFELADEPILIVVVVTAAQKDQLLSRLDGEGCELFYVAQPVEFGTAGPAPAEHA